MADVEAQINGVPENQPASTTPNPEYPLPAHAAAPRLTSTTTNPQTAYYPIHSRPPNSAFSRPQATGANDRPHGNVPPSRTVGIPGMLIISHFTSRILIPVPGEKYGDSSDAVWSMYLTEAEKQDKDVIERWKGDTDGILVFVSPIPSCIYLPADC
jgi:hypothetical protein